MDAHQFQQQKEQEKQGSEVQVPMEVEADSSVKSEEEKKQELENVRKRLKEIEEEASKLRAKFDIEGAGQASEEMAAAAALAEKEEVDSRSIFVGNVDYECTPEEVQQHFHACGTVNRVTIMSDGFGNPKGFAYVEFVEAEAVQNALLLTETELHGRLIKVSPKRTNLPGMKQFRGRRFPRGPFMSGPPPFVPSYGYVRTSRGRHRYSPY